MYNWQKNKNYRKIENSDGSAKYIITVDNTDVEVTKDVYMEYASSARKMEHFEHRLKRDRVLQDSAGKAVTDENGMPIKLPEREVSLEKLVCEEWDFESSEPSPEAALLVSEDAEITKLHSCINLLSKKEQTLIKTLFFEGKTIREYAEITGTSKSSIDRQKTKIISKLKVFFEN